MENKLPGFGLPLEQMPKWSQDATKPQERFPHAIVDFFSTSGVTLRERRMLDFINQVTDKPRWTEKIKDESIVNEWRDEACGTDDAWELNPRRLSPQAFDYCLAELRDKANYLRTRGVVHVLDCSATIVKKDLLETNDLCRALNEAVRPLENVPDHHKDWHPDSNDMVLDLLHPSLYALQYGITRALPSGKVPMRSCALFTGHGTVIPVPDVVTNGIETERVQSWGNEAKGLKPWGSFQWLPSDITFGADGLANIDTYVNNLHPQTFSGLYTLLASAVDEALPLWEDCLSWFHERLRIAVDSCGFDDFRKPEHLARDAQADEAGVSGASGGSDDSEHSDAFSDHGYELEDWLSQHPGARQVEQREPKTPYQPFEDTLKEKGTQRIDLRKAYPAGLQVIFKLANIHLTPEKPSYDGSRWHVEGALNEHICATALVYYDQENISDSHLKFRQQIDAEEMIMKPQQNEFAAAEDLYGIVDGDAAIQDIGQVLTRPGRILAFPNVMQHRVTPFELRDKTKPGHRKILAMFLVDPHTRILSTAHVPPQRTDWWGEEVRKIRPFAALPTELFDRIIAEVDGFPLSWENACDARLKLMAERGRMQDEFQNAVNEDTFFFCEH